MKANWTALLLAAACSGLAATCSIASAGLVAYYPLDGNLNDASGNGNTGTAGSTLTFGASGSGRSGAAGDQGIVSSGNDPNQYFTSPVNINNFPQVTFGGWFATTATDPVRGLITNDSGGFGRGIDLDNRNGLNGYAAFNGSGPFGQTGGVTPSATGFDFVAAVYDQTTNTSTLDVNGTFFTVSGSPPAGDPFLTIGKNFHFDAPFGGTIDDVFVYNQALTQSQLNAIQASGVPEPASLTLLGLGALSLLAAARRRNG